VEVVSVATETARVGIGTLVAVPLQRDTRSGRCSLAPAAKIATAHRHGAIGAAGDACAVVEVVSVATETARVGIGTLVAVVVKRSARGGGFLLCNDSLALSSKFATSDGRISPWARVHTNAIKQVPRLAAEITVRAIQTLVAEIFTART